MTQIRLKENMTRDEALTLLEVANAEALEQARLLGISAERELRLVAERDALIHDNAEYVGIANALATENQRLRDALREALEIARDFVVEALAQERDAYRGHESVSDIADIERCLGQIDAALAQGEV